MKGRSLKWSDEELAWIEARKDWPRKKLHEAYVERFQRHDVSEANLTALCKRHGWMTGRTGQFGRGHEPHNKGRKGFRPPGIEKGFFKKGERNGVALKLYKPIGTERITHDGYVQRKINDDLPSHRRWRGVHLIRWEDENGPLPEGHALKCLDGNKQNTEPSNWVCLPRAMLPRLNGRFGREFDSAPVEVRAAILATVRLEHAARELRKSQKRKSTK